MPMINTLKQIIFMRTALWVNAFLYYLKRLPLAGKLVPDSVYANYPAKKNTGCRRIPGSPAC